MIAALIVTGCAAVAGWVTQMQSKFGVQASHAADIWASDLNEKHSQIYSTMGYYWHAPQDFNSNRGLGGGIQWAWDDSLCKQTRGDQRAAASTLEDQFKEDFFFASFISCTDIKASLHRAFQVWEDMHQHIQFVDVTEECRRLHGRVQQRVARGLLVAPPVTTLAS